LLILDEPTAAPLGVKQSGVVFKYISKADEQSGVGVVFIMHNPHHAKADRAGRLSVLDPRTYKVGFFPYESCHTLDVS
jgi:ABC-type sugar transport system ATPase subunit